MKKRLIGWCVVGVVLAAGLALAIPDARYPILAYFRDETLCNGRPIGYWIDELKQGDTSARRRAALSLGDAAVCEKGERESAQCRAVIDALVEAMGDSDGVVRKIAATSFLLYSVYCPVSADRANVERLCKALRDDEVAVRRAAARALWQAGPAIKDAGAVAPLAEALSDHDDQTRENACRALAPIGPDAKAAAPALLKRLRSADEDAEIRTLAAKALGLIGPQALGPLLPDVVDAQLVALKGEPEEMREYAARALGRLGEKRAIPALRQAARDRDADVRAAADEALKLLASQAAPKMP